MVGRTNVFWFGSKESADLLELSVVDYSGVYDSAAHGVAASVNPIYADKTTIQYSSDNVIWGENSPTRASAGSMIVYVRAVNPNFVTATATGSIIIDPAPVTLTADSGTKTYTGSSQSITTFKSSVSGLSFSGVSATGSGTSAGSYNVTITGVTLNSTRDTTRNYVITKIVDGTLTINPAPVTLTADSGTKTYNKSSQSITTFTCSVSGLTFASTVKASGSGTNAGAYDVTFSGVTLNSTKDTTGNYVVTKTVNGKLTINPASVTLTANSDTSKTYTGSAQTVSGFTCSVSGLTFASTVKASGSGTNVGTYNVTFSGVTLNSTKDTTGNYVVTKTVNGSLKIGKADAKNLGLSVTAYTGNYDGSAHTVTVSVRVTSGTTIQYSTNNSTWSTTAPTRTAVGQTTVYVRALNDNYNTATGSASIVINEAKATLTVSWVAGQYGFLYDPDGNVVFAYDTSGYWTGTPTKVGTYIAQCTNVDPNMRSVYVSSTTSGNYLIAW